LARESGDPPVKEIDAFFAGKEKRRVLSVGGSGLLVYISVHRMRRVGALKACRAAGVR